MPLSDRAIRDLCFSGGLPMIEPFSEAVSGNGVISWGLTSAGYDVRLCGKEILVFTNASGEVVDPKRFGDEDYRKKMFDTYTNMKDGQKVRIRPGGYILGQTLEYIRIPRNISARCVGKSTLARSGVFVNTTPMEPEWEGHLTLEIGNMTPSHLDVYVGEGIAQFQFDYIEGKVEVSYRDKSGKYNRQVGVTPAKVL